MASSSFSHTPITVDKVETKYRKIITQIPVPESIPFIERLYKLESHSMHGQMPIVWDRAVGFQVYDKWGNKWIDFTSTIFVTNSGHGNPRIIHALENVLKKPLLHTYTYLSEERIEYLEYLIENTPIQFQKAFLLSAGTETTEVALKLMRLNGEKYSPNKKVVICFEGNWHGRTLGAQMMSGNPAQKSWMGYHDPNIIHLPFPYPWIMESEKEPRKFFRDSLNAVCAEKGIDPQKDVCGIMMETFQGWGAIFYPKEFVHEVETYTKEVNALLAFDEMQAGFGRTGKLFGYMNYEVEPDILCCGKGVSSSLPLSLVLGSAEIMDLPDIGSMSSTHSANPMVCAAGLANLKAILEDGLLENSRRFGLLFHVELNKLLNLFPDHIYLIQGKGLIAAMIFKSKAGEPLSKLCDKISELCLQRGLLVVHTGRDSIKLAPPLVITKDALLEGISVLKESIKDAIQVI
ncbi:MAG: aspartate aminotransferase family protein [Opitutae bacterium]|jgi:4-aminobutyrate aminotransferase / (S)-3-amino-2-methylpropionate transaminase / 5-aminovalerate transaminase|nr:aspartate aminotransferase family protein [Opitutae bacterium]